MKRFSLILISLIACSIVVAAPKAVTKIQAQDAMKRAVESIYKNRSNNGGFLWNYTTDNSRLWGELQAYPSNVWVEFSTPQMGQLMIDAYHATGDEFYYQMACKTADILVRGQLPCGGWGYKFDLAGMASEKRWFATIGKNAWGAGEHTHFYGNATFDDNTTAGVTNFLMRLYLEKNDTKYKYPLDRVLNMILESQYEAGGWPQRYPLMYDYPDKWGNPDYTSCLTFNDGVMAHNIDILLKAYLLLGQNRVYEPIIRAMNCVRTLQQGYPSAGWADQYDLQLRPAKARDFEPAAISAYQTRECIYMLIDYYKMTGETKFLNGIPDAISFLESITLDPTKIELDNKAAATAARVKNGAIFCARFTKPGTQTPLFIHRKGLHVANGEYYVDQNPRNVIEHYSSFAVLDIEKIKRDFEMAKGLSVEQATKDSPLLGNASYDFARYFVPNIAAAKTDTAAQIVASLNKNDEWITTLGWTTVPYIGEGSPSDPVPEKYSETLASPYNTATPLTETLEGVNVRDFIQNISTLIAFIIK